MEAYEAQYKRPYSGWCSAANCFNQRGTCSGISFFTFPASPERCKTWAINAGRPDLEKRSAQDSKTLRRNNALCEEHFHKDQFMCLAEKGVLYKRKRLMPKAIPTLFDEHAKKFAFANTTDVDECNVLKKENGNQPGGEQLVEALRAPKCGGVKDSDILPLEKSGKQNTDLESDRCRLMSTVANFSDKYATTSLETAETSSDKYILRDIVAGDCLECTEPLHSDPSEVTNLKRLLRRKIHLIQRLKNRVQTLKTINNKYRKPEGIIHLASSYLQDEDLAAFAHKLQNSMKQKRDILIEQEDQSNYDA